MDCENKSNADNGRGNLNCLKIIQKMPRHHTGKPRHKGATEKGHTVRILRKVMMSKYETFFVGNNIIHTKKCDHSIAAILCTAERWFISGVYL